MSLRYSALSTSYLAKLTADLKRLRFIGVKRLREYHCHSPDRRYLKYHEYITCSAQAKIMIAKKMGMTIGGTNQAAMMLILRSSYWIGPHRYAGDAEPHVEMLNRERLV